MNITNKHNNLINKLDGHLGILINLRKLLSQSNFLDLYFIFFNFKI